MSEQRLRAAFEQRAARVSVAPDALPVIRDKVRQATRRRRRTAVGVGALATAALVGLTAVLVGLPSPGPGPNPSPPVGSGQPSTVEPNRSPSPNPSRPGPGPTTVTAPVYFSGADRLFREYLAVAAPAPDGAIERSIGGHAADPDYGTRWPSGTRLRSTSLDAAAGVGSVDLTGLPAGFTPDPLAVQQLVYTYTAVMADQGTQVSGVRVSVDGVPVPGPQPVPRASTVDTLAPLWLISPQHGATVGTTFDVHLAGSVFEAASRLRVRDAAGAVVRDDPVLLSAGAPARGEAHVQLTLAPGSYTLEVYFVSQRDGSEQGLDDHAITVS
jgi:hypothetical protein